MWILTQGHIDMSRVCRTPMGTHTHRHVQEEIYMEHTLETRTCRDTYKTHEHTYMETHGDSYIDAHIETHRVTRVGKLTH